MKIRWWSMSFQKDERFKIWLEEDVPFWKLAVSSGWDFLCEATKGWIGGHGSHEFLWKIPIGPPKRDEDGFLENSIAGALFDLEQWVYTVTDFRDNNLISILISDDQAKIIDEHFYDRMTGLDNDDDS